MSAKELAKYIGETATWRVEKMFFLVEVLDARQVYGKIQYLIKPVSGGGEQWVENLSFQEPAIRGAGVSTQS